MATQLKLRRGTTAQHSTFTGAAGEITVDTDKKTVVVHDGVTAGGKPLLKAEQVSAFGLTLLDDPDADTMRSTLGAQAALGFVPVQQGGGTGQATNKVYLGWNGNSLSLQVDNINFGCLLHQNVNNSIANVNLDSVVTPGIYQYEHSNGANTNHPTGAAGYGIFVVLRTPSFITQILYGDNSGVFVRTWYAPSAAAGRWHKLTSTMV